MTKIKLIRSKEKDYTFLVKLNAQFPLLDVAEKFSVQNLGQLL